METTDDEAYKSLVCRAESGGNDYKSLEKRISAHSGPRGRWFKSSHSDHASSLANSETGRVRQDASCFLSSEMIGFAPAASLIVPSQRFGIKGTQSQNAPVRRFDAAFPPKAGSRRSRVYRGDRLRPCDGGGQRCVQASSCCAHTRSLRP